MSWFYPIVRPGVESGHQAWWEAALPAKPQPCPGHQEPGRSAFKELGAEAVSSRAVRVVLRFET